VVETIFEELTHKGKTNLLSVAQTLASLAFGRTKNESDQEWLLRRYRQMFDLVKDTPVYKEMVRDAREEGREEGLKEGLEEGREEGQKEALQQMLMDIIAARFPKLVRFARRQLSDIDDPALLRLLVLKVSTAQTAEEAREQLLTIVEEADDDQEKGQS
jgi:predicted transposase YdaD